MGNNLDIFIGTQKTFTPKVKNSIYKIVVGNHEIENDSNLELINCKHDSVLDDRFYSELYMLDYISKNYDLKEYVGFCHNRRYFNFFDNIPDLDEIFEKYDAITAKPIEYKTRTVKQDYGKCHNVEDLYIVGGIISDKYPDYIKKWNNFINGKILIPYNMFIMKSEDFKEYVKFIFDILDEYVKIVGTDINKRIEGNKDKYLKDFYPNSTEEYQYRIGGYLAERLTNLFIMEHFERIKTYPVVLTENKYFNKKTSIELIKCAEKDDFYGYVSDLKNIDENILTDKKYIATYQIDKKFDFQNSTITVNELFSQYDAVVASPLKLKESVREQYAKQHNIEDLNIVEKIIDEKYPEYSHFCKVFLDGKIFVPYNMFIMKIEDYKKYHNFVFEILNEYLNIVGKDINKRIKNNKDKYIKKFRPNNTIKYQRKIGGYLAERLTNIFLMNNFKKMKIYPVIITEDKYNNKKEQKI